MLPSKPKSGLFESSINKNNAQGSPKVGKTSRIGTTNTKSDTGPTSPMAKKTSPIPKPRISSDRLLKTVDSKALTKNGNVSDKKPRAMKELQEKSDVFEKDLKKARERLASVEQEKIKAIEELKGTSEKLREATETQKRTEERLEKEKARADELENARKEAAAKRDEEFHKEIENVRCQHALAVSRNNSMTEELERIKIELMEASNSKEAAFREANDAKKAAEIYAEKVEHLTKEVSQIKSSDNSNLRSNNKEAAETVKKLEAEINKLNIELGRAREAEEKLAQMEALVDQLQLEVNDARKCESNATELVDQWRKKTEILKVELEEAYQSEKSASDSLATIMEQLEEGRSLLEDAESEISTLQGKIKSLEIELAKQKKDTEESDKQLDSARQDALNIGKTVELLKLELQNREKEKLQAINSEKVAGSKVKNLMEENNRLNDELKFSKDEEEKAKMAMEGLASALQILSTEAREKEERLLRTQAEIEESQAEIEQLNIALRNTEERYEVMLDEARYEIVCLKKIIERFETEATNTSSERDAKELNFIHTIRTLEEEIASLKVEMAKMAELQKVVKQETQEPKSNASEVKANSNQVEAGADCAYEAAKESKPRSLRLQEALLDSENESTEQENEDLQMEEAAELLVQTTARKVADNCELSNSIKYLEKGNCEGYFRKLNDYHKENYKQQEESRNGHNNQDKETAERLGNDLIQERDHEEESIDDDLESDIDGSSNNQTDGTTASTDDSTSSPNKLNQQQKKKALLHKFGNLLKKGNY